MENVNLRSSFLLMNTVQDGETQVKAFFAADKNSGAASMGSPAYTPALLCNYSVIPQLNVTPTPGGLDASCSDCGHFQFPR